VVRDIKNPKPAPVAVSKPAELERLETQLSSYFESTVAINRTSKGKGKIQISFASDSELEQIISKLNG
jgi:hypothetical protein